MRDLVQGDLGPSLLAFPTPAMTLVMRALPWTLFLLTTAVLITWVGGNHPRRAGRILPEQPAVQGRRRRGHRRPADSLLHRGLSPAVPLRLHMADPADIGRLRHGRPAGLEHRLHPLGRPARHPADHVADPRRIRHLVPGHARPGLEHRHRGLRDLCRAGGRAAQTAGHLLCDAQRRRAAVDRPGPRAGSRLLRHDHHRTGLHLPRHGDAVGRRRQSRRQHHGARGVHGFHRCGSGCDLHRRPVAPPPRPADQAG